MSAHTDLARQAALSRADRHNIDTWEALRAADPELARLEIAIARVGKILAADHPSTPQYAQARLEDIELRARRYALWSARAGAGAGTSSDHKP